MALKESILNLNKALKMTLQNVPAVVDTLTRGLKDVADAADEQSTYSTDEHEVGTWIDGKKVYEKTIDFGALPNNTYKAVSISGIQIIEFTGFSTRENGVITIPIQFIDAGQTVTGVGMYATATELRVITNSDRSAYTNTYVTIKYIKTEANRMPESDTRNGKEDVPDVKAVDDPDEELKK